MKRIVYYSILIFIFSCLIGFLYARIWKSNNEEISKETNIVSAFFANIFTAFPGKLLLSCKSTGILLAFAATTTAPHIYPPVPITMSGLNSFTIFLASPIPLYVLYNFFRLSIDIFLFAIKAIIAFIHTRFFIFHFYYFCYDFVQKISIV